MGADVQEKTEQFDGIYISLQWSARSWQSDGSFIYEREKEVDIPINYYAIQALNTGEGSTAAERAAKAWEKYVNQNNGQKGQVTAPQSEPEQTEAPGI